MLEFFDYLCAFVLYFRLQAQEPMLAQSQKCVQELTCELRNRCLELRELSCNMQDQEKLLQVRGTAAEKKKIESNIVLLLLKQYLNHLSSVDIFYFLGFHSTDLS